MGLFVVGRIAARHGIRVGLRGPAAGESGSGTTAEIYLPPTVFEGAEPQAEPRADRVRAVTSPSAQLAQLAGALTAPDAVERREPQPVNPNGSGPPVTVLPRRSPGSSGITEVPAPRAEQLSHRPRRDATTTPGPIPAVSDTSAFFAARARNAAEGADDQASTPAVPKAPAPPEDPADEDVIYRRMLSEMMGDPHDLVSTPDLDWQSVWDHGWTLAAEAEEKPVEARTAGHGLPVRKPGERLVPGAANAAGSAGRGEPDARSANGREPHPAATGPLARDPEAVRASFNNHFGGVHSGRSHARDTSQGTEEQ
jgi:hypothetical protein